MFFSCACPERSRRVSFVVKGFQILDSGFRRNDGEGRNDEGRNPLGHPHASGNLPGTPPLATCSVRGPPSFLRNYGRGAHIVVLLPDGQVKSPNQPGWLMARLCLRLRRGAPILDSFRTGRSSLEINLLDCNALKPKGMTHPASSSTSP